MARHFLNLHGARTLPTESLLLVERSVADLAANSAMGAFHGPAGLGKTFAVEQALARCTDTPNIWISFPSGPTQRQVAAALYEALTGVAAPPGSRFALTAPLLDELAGRSDRVVVVVDEAQQLNRVCIEFLRHLHDHPRTDFALLLVGGDNAWTVLSREPMLRSRIYRRVAFSALSSTQVCALIPTFHPLYRNVDIELLLLIDDRFAHGNLRDWAAFTHTAVNLCAELGRDGIDERVVRNAFTLHGGGRR